jgi:hypothetical protein
MKTMYMLLNPLTPESFGIDALEFHESLAEFGCKAELVITNTPEATKITYFATAPDRKTLERLITEVNLDGNILEVTNIWDNILTEN